MINIVIPMAGEGSRFAAAGYTTPKPFIDVNGKTMVEQVLDNLACPDARFILIARKKHMDDQASLVDRIRSRYNARFIPVERLTQGTACTVLFARKEINNDTPLIIANSDQLVDLSMADFIEDSRKRGLDGSILTFVDRNRDPKWSFARLNRHNHVVEVKEKTAISDIATVGIYLFTRGHYFVDAAIDMIIEDERVNNEFYTCPTYNYIIREGKKIGVFHIDPEQMHGLGTPDDLNAYLNR